MRRVSLLLALTLLTTALASGTATGRASPGVAALRTAVVAPQLQLQLDSAGQDEMVEAIVVLKSQADLASVRLLPRENRPGAAARILRARADLTQRPLRRCSSAAGRRAWSRIWSRCGSSMPSPSRPRPQLSASSRPARTCARSVLTSWCRPRRPRPRPRRRPPRRTWP
jgi:hypothetical protein